MGPVGNGVGASKGIVEGASKERGMGWVPSRKPWVDMFWLCLEEVKFFGH